MGPLSATTRPRTPASFLVLLVYTTSSHRVMDVIHKLAYHNRPWTIKFNASDTNGGAGSRPIKGPSGWTKAESRKAWPPRIDNRAAASGLVRQRCVRPRGGLENSTHGMMHRVVHTAAARQWYDPLCP